MKALGGKNIRNMLLRKRVLSLEIRSRNLSLEILDNQKAEYEVTDSSSGERRE